MRNKVIKKRRIPYTVQEPCLETTEASLIRTPTTKASERLVSTFGYIDILGFVILF
jgi:hypothetical protein